VTRRAVVLAVAHVVAAVAVGGACVDVDAAVADGCDAHAVDVVAYDAGAGGGFGADRLPAIALGPPDARVEHNGGSIDDVVSLGDGGSIVVELGCGIADGDGVDFVVHENPFAIAGTSLVNTEAGVVGVSVDGVGFVDFACDGADYVDDGDNGCAGMAVGGDGFDLGVVGVDGARYVRVVDRADDVDVDADPGAADGKVGFDFDAVVVVHAAD
jgi:hypothetical protein